MIEEVGELANGLNKGNNAVIKDSIGDSLVVLISTGLKILAQYEPIIEALIKQGKIKGHNTGEGGIGADPAGNGGFGV